MCCTNDFAQWKGIAATGFSFANLSIQPNQMGFCGSLWMAGASWAHSAAHSRHVHCIYPAPSITYISFVGHCHLGRWTFWKIDASHGAETRKDDSFHFFPIEILSEMRSMSVVACYRPNSWDRCAIYSVMDFIVYSDRVFTHRIWFRASQACSMFIEPQSADGVLWLIQCTHLFWIRQHLHTNEY